MNMLPWIACGVLAAGFLMSRTALAEECVTQAHIEARASADGAVVANDFRDTDAQTWLNGYNAYPPPTDHAADQVLVLLHPMRPAGLVVLMVDGCVTAVGEVGRGLLLDLEELVLGDGA